MIAACGAFIPPGASMAKSMAKKKSKKHDEGPSCDPSGKKELVVTEKPSVARDIKAAMDDKGTFESHKDFFESKDFVITWAIGHLLEFLSPEEIDPSFKRWRLTDLPIFPDPFVLKPKAGQKARLNLLKKLLNRKDVVSVVNACDAGREGELIFREICNHLGNGKPVRRLWLQSMTPKAIRDGFASLEPGTQFDGLGSAAECRAESDWLIGINATRALTKRLQTRKERAPWSVGRVQTPTLALLVDRELEILSHKIKPYWRIKVQFAAPDHHYEAGWFRPEKEKEEEGRDDWILDPGEAQEILGRIEGKPGTAQEKRKAAREKAPPPFDLTSLQREANRRFGYSARRTLEAAQKLYERYKLITYPRTDSRCLPNDYEPKVNEVIVTLSKTPDYAEAAGILLQSGLRNRSKVFNDSGVSDHFAIMPTGMKSEKLTQEVGRVYDLVVRRFLSAFFPVAVWENVERITKVDNEHFRTRSRVLKEPGWQLVFEKKVEEQEKLPPIGKGEIPVTAEESEIVEEEAKPPSRISEAGLLRLMENAGKQIDDEELSALMRDKGLGTAATRAEIIENLISKIYVRRAGKSLAATAKGIRLIDILRRIHVDRLASAELTGELEQHLRELERGKRSRETFTQEMRDYTSQIVERAKAFEFDDLYRGDSPLGACPVCKQGRVVEEALFYRCEGVPKKTCTFLIWKEKQGRYLDRNNVETLLSEGKTSTVAGFFTQDGKPYTAVLELDTQGRVQTRSGNGGGDLEPEGPIDPSPVAKCPVCPEGEVMEAHEGYLCSQAEAEGCAFKLPRKLCQRALSRDEVKAFVSEGKTGYLDGFISRRGRPFSASLVLGKNGRIDWDFPPRGTNGSSAPVDNGEITDHEPLGSCPLCKDGKVLTAERAYVCRQGREGCAFSLPRVLLGREMNREEASDYVVNGRTEILEGFTSRRGRPFSAALVRKKNGKLGYEFPPRSDS